MDENKTFGDGMGNGCTDRNGNIFLPWGALNIVFEYCTNETLDNIQDTCSTLKKAVDYKLKRLIIEQALCDSGNCVRGDDCDKLKICSDCKEDVCNDCKKEMCEDCGEDICSEDICSVDCGDDICSEEICEECKGFISD